MLTYQKISLQIERVAKISAIVTLFALPISTSGTTALFLFTTLLVILSGHWKEKISLIRQNPIALSFLGFFLIFLLGTLYSVGSATDIKHQLARWSWLILAPFWIPLFTEAKWRQRGLNAFLAAMTITLLLSYAKYFHWITNPYFWDFLAHRISGSLTSVFKDYLIQSFLMSLAAIIFLNRCIESKRWTYGILFLLAAIHILFISQARTDYIIFILLLLSFSFSKIVFKKALLISIICLSVISLLFVIMPGPIHKRVQLVTQDIQHWKQGNKQTSLGYRFDWQDNALQLIQKKPFIGYGTGSIQAAFATLPQKDTKQTGIVNNASNEYLNITVQFGVIGLLIFLGILLLQWRFSFFLASEQKLLIQSLLIALGIANLANSWLMDFTQGYSYALMMMLSFAALSAHPTPSTAQDHAYNDDAATDTLS